MAEEKIEVPPAAKGSELTLQLMSEGPQYLARANALQVTNEAEHKAAIDLLQLIARRDKQLEEEREKISKPQHQAWTATNQFFAKLRAPFSSVSTIVRKKVCDHEERVRIADQERQRKADEDARIERERIEREAAKATKEAEEKAAKIAHDAELRRKEAEEATRKANELAAAGDAEAAAAAQREASFAAGQAKRLESRAATVTANAAAKVEGLQERAQSVVAVQVQRTDLKVAGKSNRKVWKWEVTDAAKVERRYLTPDEKKIGDLVKAMKSEAAEMVGGIRVWEEDDLSIKAKP